MAPGKGRYGDVSVDGLNILGWSSFPAANHLGNATTLYLVDEQADSQQREALGEMLTRDLEILPFGIFLGLTTNLVPTRYVPFQLHLDGIHSRATVPSILAIHLEPMKNPVTGKDELATLLKPTGFTSQSQELCSTSLLRITTEEITADHSGKYGEYAPFEYSSP